MAFDRLTLCTRAAASALSLYAALPAGAQTWLNETGLPLECDYCNLQFPSTMSVQTGQVTPTVYGQLFEAGLTEAPGSAAAVLVQLGYGPLGSDPRAGGWSWFAATFNTQVGNNDEYQAGFIAPVAGSYSYTFRYSLDGGQSFSAGDLDGAGANGGLVFSPAQLGVVTVDGGGAPVPEPGAWALMAAGLAVLALRRARRGRQGQA